MTMYLKVSLARERENVFCTGLVFKQVYFVHQKKSNDKQSVQVHWVTLYFNKPL